MACSCTQHPTVTQYENTEGEGQKGPLPGEQKSSVCSQEEALVTDSMAFTCCPRAGRGQGHRAF